MMVTRLSGKQFLVHHLSHEHVGGQLFGGDNLVGGLYYEGRRQGSRIVVDKSDNADQEMADIAITEMNARLKSAPETYKKEGWELRILQ